MRIACVVGLVFFCSVAVVLNDFGPTWDLVQGDYPHGERLLAFLERGDRDFLDLSLREPRPEVRQPHLALEQKRFTTEMVHPFGGLFSAACCRILWTELGLFGSLVAHHLGALIPAALLVWCITAFGIRHLGVVAGVVAGASLAFAPAFFGHAAGNVKDIPECALYTGAVLLGWRALENGRPRAWLPAGVLVGLALATKPNAVFLVPQLVLFLGLVRVFDRTSSMRLSLAGLGWTALGSVGTWYAASPTFWVAPIAGPAAWIDWVIVCGNKAFQAGQESRAAEVSFHAPLAVLQTTPLVTLALASIGAFTPGIPRALRIFLLVGAGLPVARLLVPGMRDYGGVRHFMEFLPMLCLLAGAGAAQVIKRLLAWLPEREWLPRTSGVAVLGLAIGPPVFGVVSTHPNQALYRNVLVGGLAGARARGAFDLDDSWGNTLWAGQRWVARHAEPGASILVVHGAFVARASFPLLDRADLRWCPEATPVADPRPLYVLVLSQCQETPAVQALERRRPVHTIGVQGAVLLSIYRIDSAIGDSWYEKRWLSELGNRADWRRIAVYLRKHPELGPEMMRLRWLEPERALVRGRTLLPAELHEAFESAILLTDGNLFDMESANR